MKMMLILTLTKCRTMAIRCYTEVTQVNGEREENILKRPFHHCQSKSLECGMATGCVKIVNKAFEFDHLGKFIPAHKRAKDVDLFRGNT